MALAIGLYRVRAVKLRRGSYAVNICLGPASCQGG